MGVAAKAAVGGAIDAAGTLGQSALRAVTDILVGAVEGVKEVACAALPKTASPAPPVETKPAPEKESPHAKKTSGDKT
jgi:hypothetical protein